MFSEAIYCDEFSTWIDSLTEDEADRIFAAIGVLEEVGPNLKRPQVGTIKGSLVRNLKELRVQIAGKPWRILFAYDKRRRPVMLAGGDKSVDARWYDINIPPDEARFLRHQAGLKN